jgi:hypothetical protein
MKHIVKRMISLLASGVIAAAAAPIAVFASDYADMIKYGCDNNEVSYNGQAYVTELSASESSVKPVITIEKKTVYMCDINAPQTVNVAISGSNRKYDSVGLHFLYDTRLEVVYNEFGECVTYNGNLSYECTDLGDGELFVANMGVKGKDGDAVWQIDFRLPENAKPGDLFPIGIEYRTSSITEDCFTNLYGNEEGKLMQAWLFTQGINNGYIKVIENDITTTTVATVPEPEEITAAAKAGDINGDGRINPVDASKVLMMFAELASGETEITADILEMYDIDGDGKITSVDASLVLAYCANLAEDPTLALEDYIAEIKG